MTTPFTFSVHGTPRPQPRPRFVPGRKRPVSTANPKAKLWRLAVGNATKAALSNRGDALPLFVEAIEVAMVFTFVPPPGHEARIGTPHTHKPDASNLLKLVEDVMEDCRVFANDSAISRPVPEKWWGERAGVAVIVRSLDGVSRAADASAWARQAPSWLAG